VTIRRRSLLPWLVVAVVAAVFLLLRYGGESTNGGPPRFEGAPSARVQRVVDGDTVRFVGIGRVRLIGVDTPEVYGHVECFGPEASAFTKSLLAPGTTVRYRVGAEPRDRYGRLLAYVWLHDGQLLNRMLVERGFATVLTIAPNDRLAPVFTAASARARERRVGLWRRPHCAQ
jgi:micrococcal nuclease